MDLDDDEPAAGRGRMFTMPVNYSLSFEPDAAPGAISTYDQTRSAIYNVSPREDHDTARMFTYSGNLTYVTGAHAFKVGTQVRTGWSQELFTTRGDLIQVIVQRQAQLRVSDEHAERPQGVRRQRRALRAGFVAARTRHAQSGPAVREFAMSIPAKSAPAGSGCPPAYPAQDGIVNWNTLSPRFGFSWDVFGYGETAVKGGVSRYDRLEGITLVQPLNQRNIARQTCPWTDTNGDLTAQNSEINFAKCSGSLLPSLGQLIRISSGRTSGNTP